MRAGSAGFCYRLGLAGQRLLAITGGGRSWEPGAPFVAHTLAITEAHVRLVEAARSDRGFELVRFETEPRCWRTIGTVETLKPDGWFVLRRGEFEEHWFLEVDCATESLPAIRRKIDRYQRYFQTGREQSRHGLFPRVMWSVPSTRRQQQLAELFDRTHRHSGLDLHRAVLAEDVASQPA